MEETLLGVYGADGWRGAAKERIKLQSELDRARDQVLLLYWPLPPPAPRSKPAVLFILLFRAAESSCVSGGFCAFFHLHLRLSVLSSICIFVCLLSRGLKHNV